MLNDDIRDLQIRHSVGVQRLSAGVVRRMIQLLDKSDAEIVAKLLSRGPTLDGSFTSQRLQFLLRALRQINHDGHVQLGQELRQEFRDFARYEVDFQQRLLASAVPVAVDFVSPSAQMIDAVVTARPFNGKLLRDSIADLEVGKYKALREGIQLGIIQGETTAQIVQRIRGTKALNYRDGILDRSRTAVTRMVRTATNHVANAARETLYEENDDLIDGVQWVATLDTRTCPTCGELDGKTFKIGKGPRPPRHLNCRCCTTPVLKSWRSMGINVDEAPAGTRASMNGQVSATETYNSWLKGQSAATQDEALGATRGKLFRAGGLDVDRFTDTRGNQLTLAELAKREAGAFTKAGV